MNFEVGDEVEWCGVRGVVKIVKDISGFPVVVELETGHIIGFTEDGKFFGWHKEPSLKLVKKKEKLVKKVMWRTIYSDDPVFVGRHLYKTNEQAWSQKYAIGTEQVEIEMKE